MASVVAVCSVQPRALPRAAVPLAAVAAVAAILWRLPGDYAFGAYALAGGALIFLSRTRGAREIVSATLAAPAIALLVRVPTFPVRGPVGGVPRNRVRRCCSDDGCRSSRNLARQRARNCNSTTGGRDHDARLRRDRGYFPAAILGLAPAHVRRCSCVGRSVVRRRPRRRCCSHDATLTSAVVDVQAGVRLAPHGTLRGRSRAVAAIWLRRPGPS